MFTGIIERLGVVEALTEEEAGYRLQITEPQYAQEVAIGESIAVNGVCLTVVAVDSKSLHFQVGPETIAKTNLGGLEVDNRVNLERALRVGDRLGGHWLQGHVDSTGQITSKELQGEYEIVWFSCSEDHTQLMVPKGSIAVDGISLTLVDVHSEKFSVMLIPHTLTNTTLGYKKVGDEVNLELDILGKYVLKIVSNMSIKS